MLTSNYKTTVFSSIVILLFILLLSIPSLAQHRGDNLAFQGFSQISGNGVKATAMGSAFTAITGDMNALFWNPAGLIGIERPQFSISANTYQKMWRENQVYRPNRLWVTLPFYLEGLYIPDPANNGRWDHEIFYPPNDTLETYIVEAPELGNDVYSEEASEWQKETDDFVLNNVAFAFPIKLAGKQIVLAGAYNRKYNVLDFDRNDTYLDPHLGYDGYGIVPRVDTITDTLHVNWSTFLRERIGDIHSFTFGGAYNLSEQIKLGFGFSSFSGKTNDVQNFNRVGYFDLARNNRLRFSYEMLDVETNGTSKFSATNFNFGTILKSERYSIGVNIIAPYTLKREWDYTTTIVDTLGTTSSSNSGEDKMDIPAAYTFGISLNPIKQFRISLDIENAEYSKAEFELANNDTTHRNWVDRNSLSFGVEYMPVDHLSIMAGYRTLPETFVPDGAAFRDRGPAADIYTFGLSFKALLGRFDVAYEIRQLKYYDSYLSNTNYVLETFNNLLFGYTIDL